LQKKSTYLTLNINATSGCGFAYFFDDKNNFKDARKLFLQNAFNNVELCDFRQEAKKEVTLDRDL